MDQAGPAPRQQPGSTRNGVGLEKGGHVSETRSWQEAILLRFSFDFVRRERSHAPPRHAREQT